MVQATGLYQQGHLFTTVLSNDKKEVAHEWYQCTGLALGYSSVSCL